MTRWSQAAVGTLLLPLDTLCASAAPRAVLDLVPRVEHQLARHISG